MADPVSITLTVVTLVTAVKDLVELAQRLERSFAKVSANFHDAGSLAAEIRQTLEQLKDFCDEHQEILNNNAQDMERSLVKLMKEMQSVYEKSCGLRSAPSESKLDKLKVTLVAWKNRNRVESSIQELRNQVNKCHANFMLFAVMRLEKRLVVSSNDNAQEFKTIRNEISSIRVSNDRLVAFVGPSSGMPSTSPPEINADFISDNYLRLQIHTINRLMERFSSGAYLIRVEAPTAVYLRPYQPTLAFFDLPSDRIVLRQDVIAQTLAIQTLLRDDSTSLSVQEGAWTMINLSAGLSRLEMDTEAVLIGSWTTKLFRTLTVINPTTYSPYLALSLSNLCLLYIEVNNLDGARSAIRECLLVHEGLPTSHTSVDLKFALATALRASAHIFAVEGRPTESLEHAQKAIMIFEATFSGRDILGGTLQSGPIGNFELAQASADFTNFAIFRYAGTLHQLANSLEGAGQFAYAVQAELRASEILTYLLPLYASSSHLELELARTFYRISQGKFRKFVEVDRAHTTSQQSVAIYRKYFEKDRRKHGKSLCGALWQHAKILGEMKRCDDALVIWQETAHLAKEIVKDQLLFARVLHEFCENLRILQRHDEAVIARNESVEVYRSVLKSASVTEAHACYNLATDLYLAGRYPESIRAAQLAVTQYRSLACRDPGQYTKDLAKGLNSLTASLIHAGQKEQAFNEGHEALQLYETLICDDLSVIQDYVWSLKLNWFVAIASDNETKSIERGQDLIRHSRQLVERFPPKAEQDSGLFRAIIGHSAILTNFDRLSEAIVAIQEALEWYDENPPDSPKPIHQYIFGLVETGNLLDQQGYIEKALVLIQKAVDVGKPVSFNPPVASMVTASMHRRAQLFIGMGRYAEAVIAGQEAVAFARAAKLENTTEFIACLQVASMAYKYNGQVEAAMGVINEALGLCRGEALAKLAKGNAPRLFYLPRCLQILSQCFAATGKESDALPLAQEAVDEALELKSQARYPTIPRSAIEPIYMDALHNLSIRMVANTNLTLALGLVVQCRTYYEHRAVARNSAFRILACVLREEGVFHCAAGHHEEGRTARAKLNDLQRRLGSVFPRLASLVEIELETHQSSSSWTALVAQLNLQCHHQDERPEIQAFLSRTTQR